MAANCSATFLSIFWMTAELILISLMKYRSLMDWCCSESNLQSRTKLRSKSSFNSWNKHLLLFCFWDLIKSELWISSSKLNLEFGLTKVMELVLEQEIGNSQIQNQGESLFFYFNILLYFSDQLPFHLIVWLNTALPKI